MGAAALYLPGGDYVPPSENDCELRVEYEDGIKTKFPCSSPQGAVDLLKALKSWREENGDSPIREWTISTRKEA